jgi:transcriptional regulator with XRE-family HTH domain
MEIGKRIRMYRTERGLTQDGLADKIFVTRQSVSNWENDKTYPDLKSILLLGSLFGVSLDVLIKGDIDVMKEKLNGGDRDKMKRLYAVIKVLWLSILWATTFLVWFIMINALLGHKRLIFMGFVGFVVLVLVVAVNYVFLARIYFILKRHNLKTYGEICAFIDGKEVDEGEMPDYEKRELDKIRGLLFLQKWGVYTSIFSVVCFLFYALLLVIGVL